MWVSNEPAIGGNRTAIRARNKSPHVILAELIRLERQVSVDGQSD